jgi:hypothetical protein
MRSPAVPASRSDHREGRIVITGMGAVTPYGVGVPAFLAGLLAARPTATLVTRFDSSAHAARVGCEVPGFDELSLLPRRLVSQTDPFGRYALIAAEEALEQAGLLARRSGESGAATRLPLADAVDAERIGAIVATSVAGMSELTANHARLLVDGPRRVRPFKAIAYPPNMAGSQIAIRHGLRGMSFTVISACASASDALGVSLDLLRSGRLDVVLAGGAEAGINALVYATFGAAGALSRRNDEPERASRPFDVADLFPARARASWFWNVRNTPGPAARPLSPSSLGTARPTTLTIRPPPARTARAAGARSASRWRMRALTGARSPTSTPMEPPPRSTTWPRRSRSVVASARTRTPSRSRAPSRRPAICWAPLAPSRRSPPSRRCATGWSPRRRTSSSATRRSTSMW